MKSLESFIVEAQDNNFKKHEQEKTNKGKTVVFNFTDIDGGDDLSKTLDGETGVTVDGPIITVAATKDNAEDLSSVISAIKKVYIAVKKTSKATNVESFAAKVKKIGNGISALTHFINDVTNDGDEEE